MAKGIYYGIFNTARRIENVYVGVNNVARRVRKAYVGVGGVARLFWNTGLLYQSGDQALRFGYALTTRNYRNTINFLEDHISIQMDMEWGATGAWVTPTIDMTHFNTLKVVAVATEYWGMEPPGIAIPECKAAAEIYDTKQEITVPISRKGTGTIRFLGEANYEVYHLELL